MIEIKSRGGRVLYTAQSAADIRTALEEAVAARADLHLADLHSANLHLANLRSADLRSANLSLANLSLANLSLANLHSADLRSANLRSANLRSANLSLADLSLANLHSADLSLANLSLANLSLANLAGAKKFNPARINHLSILAYQTGKIRAFKLVDSDLRSPMQRNGKITYEIGSIAECAKANTNQSKQCAAGVNVATAPWVLANFRPGHRIVLIEFTAKDLAAIPIGDGKFRLRRCKVIREVKPEEFGIDADGRDLVAQTEGQTHE